MFKETNEGTTWWNCETCGNPMNGHIKHDCAYERAKKATPEEFTNL